MTIRHNTAALSSHSHSQSITARAFLAELFCGPLRRPIDPVFLVRLAMGVLLVAGGFRLLFLEEDASQALGLLATGCGLFLIIATLQWDDSGQ